MSLGYFVIDVPDRSSADSPFHEALWTSPAGSQNARTRGFLMPSAAALFGSLLFGVIGLAAFIHGKKSALWQPMILGVALMAYPYFVSETWLLYGLGCALCLGLFFFRE